MSIQILSIFLYGNNGKVRSLDFRPGQVNIITGRSRTGKSAIIDIVDYCLGNSKFRVPEGIIKDAVAWYGLLLDIQGSTQVFIAKPTPALNAISQSAAHYQIGSKISPPSLDQLAINSTDAEVITSLSSLIGIKSENNVIEETKLKPPLEVDLRHTSYYLYQDQSLIANKDSLFHRQIEEYIPQTIKDTLPFFLGFAEEEYIRIEQELRIARRSLKSAQRDLDEANSIISDRLKRGKSLVEEAQQVGLIPSESTFQTSGEIISALHSILKWEPIDMSQTEDERAPALRDEIQDLKVSSRQIKSQIDITKSYLRDSDGYFSEAGEQVIRLKSVNIFPAETPADDRCPLCNSAVSSPPPAVSEIRKGLKKLNDELVTVKSESPRLQEHIDSLKSKRAEIQQQITDKEFALEAVVAEQNEADKLRNNNARIARVVGRISLYLDSVDFIDNNDSLQTALDIAKYEVDNLLNRLADRDIDVEEQQASVLNRISTKMSQWAKQLQLEHSEWPFRMDIRHLTVAIDRPGRPITMQHIGGGENWLGCHLIALLALHSLFIADNRPVPRFIILDQPSQVYFVSPTHPYISLDGTTEETLQSNADLVAVGRMFDLIFDFCKAAAPNHQVIILEHANLPNDAYQKALVEQPWTAEHALIPLDWV